ncbi:MAG: Anaerobic nitric oxide reductase transcription regulator NorR [Phycisphaerae bacterium]|nr:Anaerobic nitric oxide reductase transcription regulator NorR [Phycisphaerae bacterium]
MKRRILVVDDEPLKRITLQIELSEAGYEVLEAADARTARRLFDANPVDVVVSDVRMPGMDGFELLTYVKQASPDTIVILITAYATVDAAVEAIKRGAYDYITKPFTTQELLARLDRVFAGRATAIAADTADVESFGAFVTSAPVARRLIDHARSAAAGERTILIHGESGAGKEVIAEAIHAHSPRCAMPLARISCGKTDAEALNAELFGVEGAGRTRTGRIELADGGTLLLDLVEALPDATQLLLIDAIEKRSFTRVGGTTHIPFNVRLICTTRRDLNQVVQEGRFRADLLYRISVCTLSVPPLRERLPDIPLLARLFIAKHAPSASAAPATDLRRQDAGDLAPAGGGADDAALEAASGWRRARAVADRHDPAAPAVESTADAGVETAAGSASLADLRGAAPRDAALASPPTISRFALDALLMHTWPGNVRELEHVIERAVALADREIRPEHVLPLSGPWSSAAPGADDASVEMPREGEWDGGRGLAETVADIERRMILMALRQCNNNQARAAQKLGIPRTTLRDKMAKYGILSD